MADTSRYCLATIYNRNPDDKTITNMMSRLIPIPGIGWRHPVDWNDPCDLSRDQQLPFISVMFLMTTAITGMIDVLLKFHVRHIQRKWRCQNLDWFLPHHRDVYTPTVRRGDWLLFVESIFRVIDSYLFWDSSAGRDLNFCVMLAQISFTGQHSELSRRACRVYKWRRRGPQWAWDWYYRNNNSGIAKLWEPYIKKLILEI